MAQRLKQDVHDKIAGAALETFAQKGFEGATMVEIAKAAGVSTGNIYRYYKDKSDLFYILIPKEFVATFLDLLRSRVQLLDSVGDLRQLDRSESYHLMAEDLLEFCINNRLKVVILLGKSRGTKYEGFAEEMSQVLIMLSIARFKAMNPTLKITPAMSFNLDQIFQNFSTGTVNILRNFKHEHEIREAIGDFSRYHAAGLRGLFA